MSGDGGLCRDLGELLLPELGTRDCLVLFRNLLFPMQESRLPAMAAPVFGRGDESRRERPQTQYPFQLPLPHLQLSPGHGRPSVPCCAPSQAPASLPSILCPFSSDWGVWLLHRITESEGWWGRAASEARGHLLVPMSEVTRAKARDGTAQNTACCPFHRACRLSCVGLFL